MANFFATTFANGALGGMYTAGVETTKEYTSSQRVRRKSPKIRLLFNPFVPPLIPIEFVSEDMGGLILNCDFMKSRSQAFGTFSITMAADDRKGTAGISGWPLNKLWAALGSPSLMDIFKPMSLAHLIIDGYHVATGFLRTARKQTGVSFGTYSLQFDELGSLYTQNILKLYQFGRLQGPTARFFREPHKLLGAALKSLGFTPIATVVKNYIQAYVGSTLLYEGLNPKSYLLSSDGLPLAFRLIAESAPIGAISNNSLMTRLRTDSALFNLSAGGSFWDYLKSMISEPFMEMWTESGGRTICTGRFIPADISKSIDRGFVKDTISGTKTFNLAGINITPMLPGFNYVVMRTSPYDNALIGVTSWQHLYRYTLGVQDLILGGDYIIITDDDVISKDLGVSDYNQSTLFEVRYRGKNASTDKVGGNYPPSIATGPALPFFPGGIKTYGARTYAAAIDSTNLQWDGVVGQKIQRQLRAISTVDDEPNIPALTTLLNVWFRNAAKFKEGTIVTRGMPYARPGMALLYLPTFRGSKINDPRDIATYYIDNIIYNYQIGQNDTTTYSVIRGVPLPTKSTAANLALLLMDWEIQTPGENIIDEAVNFIKKSATTPAKT